MNQKRNVSFPGNGVTRAALGTGLILLIPLLGRFPWTVLDFVVMGTLIFTVGLAIDYVSRTLPGRYRIPGMLAVLGIGVLIWMQLAVGFVGKLITGTLPGM